MSWKAYIDTLQSADSNKIVPVERAAICGREPPACWAASDGFNVTAEEIKKLNADQNTLASSGVFLGGTKFMLVRHNFDDDTFKCLQLRSTSYSATVGRTDQTYVIGIGFKDMQAGKVSAKVFSIVEHLKKSNM